MPGAFLCELASRYCENTRRVCQEPASILLDGFLPMCRSLWELLVNTLFEMLHQAWRSLSASVYALFLTIVASMEPPMRMARELCESVAAMPSRLCESVASLPSKLCECVPSMESFTRMPRELCESATTKASELSESVAAMKVPTHRTDLLF